MNKPVKKVNKQKIPDYKLELKKLHRELFEHDREIEKLRQEIENDKMGYLYPGFSNHSPEQENFGT